MFEHDDYGDSELFDRKRQRGGGVVDRRRIPECWWNSILRRHVRLHDSSFTSLCRISPEQRSQPSLIFSR